MIKRLVKSIRFCCLFLIIFMMTACGSSRMDIDETQSVDASESTEKVVISDKEISIGTELSSADQGIAEDKSDASTEIVSSKDILQVHYIDVGQGDCTLLLCGEQSMLIDAGPDGAGTTVQYYLKALGIDTLDYVIITHPDADHIGGMDVILTKFECKNIIMMSGESDTSAYRDVCSVLEYKNHNTISPEVGSVYKLGKATVTILGPVEVTAQDNDNSVISLVEYGSTSFLFTGDAEQKGEEVLISNNIKADVYQAGHHGSETSSSESLLDAVNPEYVVISCGKGNAYGHPHENILKRFKNRGINVFRTDEQGTIIATSDGENISWDTSPSTTWSPGVPENSISDDTTLDNSVNDDPVVAVPERSVYEDETAEAVTYVLNTNSMKFHLPTCDSVKDMKKKTERMSIGFVQPS